MVCLSAHQIMTNYIFSTFIIMNNGAINFCVQVFVWILCFQFSWILYYPSIIVLVKILQRNRTNRIYRFIYLFVCYKELAHTIMEADKS